MCAFDDKLYTVSDVLILLFIPCTLGGPVCPQNSVCPGGA